MLPRTPARLASHLLTGAVGGLLALLVDLALVRATSSFWMPVSILHLGCYSGIGAIGGLGFSLWWGPSCAPSWPLVAGFWWSYVPPVLERLTTASAGSSTVLPVAVGVAGLLALSGASYGLGRFARSHPVGWGLIGIGAAIGLAVNRSLVPHPLAPRALVADFAIALAVAIAALGSRSRRRGRIGALLLGTGVAVGAILALRPEPIPRPPRPEGTPPDLILVVIDTLRLDTFEAVLESTPEGQALRRRLAGADWYANAITTAPWTPPSMASIFTGRYPDELGLGDPPGRGNHGYRSLPTSVPMLAERLWRAGYQTEAIVTNPILHRDSGFARGFMGYRLLAGPTVKMPLLTALERYTPLAKDYYQPAARVRRHTRRLLDRVDTIENPLFLWLHLMDPHDPLRDDHRLSSDPFEMSLPILERLYRREVRSALQELDRIFDDLEQAGRWENAVVVVVSDHGETFPSDRAPKDSGAGARHLSKRYGHGHALHDELVRVPLVIRPVGAEGPRLHHRDEIIQPTDLLRVLSQHLGVDLSEVGDPLRAADPKLRRQPSALLSGLRSGPPQRGIRTQDHKLILFPNEPGLAELYDLRLDPSERTNLAEEQPVLARQLRDAWAKKTDQLVPVETLGEDLPEHEVDSLLRSIGYAQ